ncbi:hypothetical protein DM860_010229 [Cuscuta australis]|uniref:Pentacotripeptide-repeat region of PRORP domain-containing protein n=1 Tax=Cuscuta australis TaxID=267555 RepID=A0A328D6T4_9ASTE|nr:hypothetical protein DM860_010229 [Cuscuta australis]
MNEKGIYKFSPQDRALQLKFICRVQGCSAAERYFSSLPEREKNEETCGTLLRCYVQQTQTEKALLHFQHMKELGFASSSLPYNEIMCLYANNGQLEKVPEVLDEMKKSKVLPDNDSYRTCISSFGSRCDLDGVEKMLKEMETQPHTVMDWFTYALAAKFYREAGGLADKAIDALRKAEERLPKNDKAGLNHLKNEVLKTWELEKTDCCNRWRVNGDYENIIKSVVELGLLDEARKLSTEWEACCNWDLAIPAIVIEGYFGKALYMEAEAMVEAWERKEKPEVHELWEYLSVLYQEHGKMVRGFECLRRCANLNPDWFGCDYRSMFMRYSRFIANSRGFMFLGGPRGFYGRGKRF